MVEPYAKEDLNHMIFWSMANASSFELNVYSSHILLYEEELQTNLF